MAMKFRERTGWRSMGDIDVIGENQVGWHQTTLYFPNVSSCTTITFRLVGGGLVGVHLTIGDTMSELGRVLTQAMQYAGGGSKVDTICHAGRLNDHLAQGGWNSGGGLAWPKQAETVRKLIKAENATSKFFVSAEGTRDIRMSWSNGALQCYTRAGGYPFAKVNDTKPWQSKTLQTV